MTDINLQANPLFLREKELRQGIELLFYAYRDFTAEPDAILARYNFGRAHHRVIYFVGRNPGITVGELLGILKITKQSLSRVLGRLVEQEFIDQQADHTAGRRRGGRCDRAARLSEVLERSVPVAGGQSGRAGLGVKRRGKTAFLTDSRKRVSERNVLWFRPGNLRCGRN